MSADEFLADSKPDNQQESESVYNAAAAYWYQMIVEMYAPVILDWAL
jgi:hypothetical protein